jgi:hypothetical protein
MQSALDAAVRQLEEWRFMVLEGGRVNVSGIAQKLDVSLFNRIRQPLVPQGFARWVPRQLAGGAYGPSYGHNRQSPETLSQRSL